MQSGCGSLVRVRRCFSRFEHSERYHFPSCSYLGLPPLVVFVPRNALIAARVVSAYPAVSVVFGLAANPQIATTIVQFVPVDVIHTALISNWDTRYYAMHTHDSCATYVSNNIAVKCFQPLKFR